MRGRFSLFLIAAALLACSTAERSAAPSTVLVFKHGKLSGVPGAMASVLREFEQRHPGVVVREEILPASTDQQHQFYVMSLDGQAPPFDLFAVDTIWVQEFARAGWIADVEALLPAARRARYFPGPLAAATFEGRLHALPWYIDAGVLFYRRDLLERHGLSPPRTWPELVEQARLVLERERDPSLTGFLWQGRQYEGLVCNALEVLRSYGTDLWTGDDGRAAAGLAFMRGLVGEWRISPSSVAIADEEAGRHAFGAGRAVFLRNWPYVWTLFQQEGSPVRGKVGIAPLPAFPGYAGAPTLGGWMLAMPKRAAHPKETGELMQYLTSPEVQRRMAVAVGYHPVVIDLYEDAGLLAVQPWLRNLQPIFATAQPRPVSPYYLLMSQAAQPELSAVVVGTRTPEAAVAETRRQTAFMLDRDGSARTGGR